MTYKVCMVPFWICAKKEGKWVNKVEENIILDDSLCILIMKCKTPVSLLVM